MPKEPSSTTTSRKKKCQASVPKPCSSTPVETEPEPSMKKKARKPKRGPNESKPPPKNTDTNMADGMKVYGQRWAPKGVEPKQDQSDTTLVGIMDTDPQAATFVELSMAEATTGRYVSLTHLSPSPISTTSRSPPSPVASVRERFSASPCSVASGHSGSTRHSAYKGETYTPNSMPCLSVPPTPFTRASSSSSNEGRTARFTAPYQTPLHLEPRRAGAPGVVNVFHHTGIPLAPYPAEGESQSCIATGALAPAPDPYGSFVEFPVDEAKTGRTTNTAPSHSPSPMPVSRSSSSPAASSPGILDAPYPCHPWHHAHQTSPSSLRISSSPSFTRTSSTASLRSAPPFPLEPSTVHPMGHASGLCNPESTSTLLQASLGSNGTVDQGYPQAMQAPPAMNGYRATPNYRIFNPSPSPSVSPNLTAFAPTVQHRIGAYSPADANMSWSGLNSVPPPQPQGAHTLEQQSAPSTHASFNQDLYRTLSEYRNEVPQAPSHAVPRVNAIDIVQDTFHHLHTGPSSGNSGVLDEFDPWISGFFGPMGSQL